ncbi:hypothetical protein ONS96_013418 [Cadophora gregata f. sp. sojae]|nr:hypothetical protein ONS96_013418 [Cadophora gregata f. sp. sojae]
MEFGGSEKKFFEYWPQGFRWTCCGTPGDQLFGCDHHGNGKMPCSCDFCKMGKPLTKKIYDKRCKSAHGKGLNLPRGPDPRSFNAETREHNEMMRKMMGMDS